MALALQNGTVPAQLHFIEPNPFIPWDEIPIRVPREATAWPPMDDGTHIGGVSSFGFSGTNVHVVRLVGAATGGSGFDDRTAPTRADYLSASRGGSAYARGGLPP